MSTQFNYLVAGSEQITGSNTLPFVSKTIAVGNNPYGISSDGTNVWVCNNTGNSVSQISCTTGSVVVLFFR